jgi:D-psicose/D-tagatose/L-ribulose 3-epimerase
MKLAVSNLAWGLAEQDRILPILSSLGVSGIEVAPTKIGDWESITLAMLANFRSHLNDNGLCISSLQAIFFGKPDAQLLASTDGFKIMCQHIDKLADIAAQLGAEVAVFGAPKNRLRAELSDAVAFELAVDRFRKLGDICQGRMKIGIEPVPEFYGSDFIQTAREDLALVQAINHSAIGLHLDTGCVFLAGDAIDIAIHEGASDLIHFHIAEPELASFTSPKANHLLASEALRVIQYDRWLSIEMKESPNAVEAVTEAVKFVKNTYL